MLYIKFSLNQYSEKTQVSCTELLKPNETMKTIDEIEPCTQGKTQPLLQTRQNYTPKCSQNQTKTLFFFVTV